MTTPLEYLYTFDLHIYVGFRSWPDDVERYCEVTYPGLDEAHPITINYMRGVPDHSLDTAIQLASEDIATYMHDPESWIKTKLWIKTIRKEQH